MQLLEVMYDLAHDRSESFAKNDEGGRGGFVERARNDRLTGSKLGPLDVGWFLGIAVCIVDGRWSSEVEGPAEGIEGGRRLATGRSGEDCPTTHFRSAW